MNGFSCRATIDIAAGGVEPRMNGHGADRIAASRDRADADVLLIHRRGRVRR
jgi:hypothetical protein